METKVALNALKELVKAGQSPWYDNIDRRLINNGKLKELFDKGILGVTSNPTIFEKAVTASGAYDADIKRLASEGRSVSEIYDALTLRDISDAADLLQETYERTGHLDGYVSIEVPPDIAHDASETVNSARKIFKEIGKPNIMIKVPVTKDGAEAIRTLTRDGINVNATLIFSIEHYASCALAYIEGLRARVADGKDVSGVFSVASVFVSRIDTKIDKILDEFKKEDLKGKAAVANSKLIYQKYKEFFNGGDFQALGKKRANAQRVLWASTSTKNPSYSDIKYVEELIGRHTVNTMPPETVEAFLDHGKAESRVESGLDAARSSLAELAKNGIKIDDICREIQDAGVKSFQESFAKLIRAIEYKTKD